MLAELFNHAFNAQVGTYIYFGNVSFSPSKALSYLVFLLPNTTVFFYIYIIKTTCFEIVL